MIMRIKYLNLLGFTFGQKLTKKFEYIVYAIPFRLMLDLQILFGCSIFRYCELLTCIVSYPQPTVCPVLFATTTVFSAYFWPWHQCASPICSATQ